MESCQAMAERSGLIGTMLETGKMEIDMAQEHLSQMMAEPMWVLSKTTRDMVEANIPEQTAQSSKENGWKTSSMVSSGLISEYYSLLIQCHH